jgi:exosortase
MSAHTAYCPERAQGDKVSTNPNDWGKWLGAAFLLTLIAVLYTGVLKDLAYLCWRDEQLSQGLLMPPLALYVAWTRREQLLAHPAASDNRGLLVVALACLMFLAGKLGAEVFLPRMSFVVLIAGLIWTFWGRKRLRILALPLLLIATSIPIPALIYNSISLPLKLLSSTAATKIAQAAGTVIYQDGNVLEIPGMSLGVEDACNGIAALSSLIASALLLGVFLNGQRRWPRLLLVLLAIPIALAVNVIRIAMTAILAESHPRIASGFYHSFSGWLVYLFGLLALFAAASVFNRLPGRPAVGSLC